MSVKDTKEEALPIDSVRRAKVALIEDWSPVTNTIQHNTRYTIDALQSHNIGWRNSARSGHDEQLVPLLLALQRVCPPPHSITVTAWRAESPRALYCASLVTTRVTLRYQRVRQGRRFGGVGGGGWWAFLGPSAPLLMTPYDVPAILARGHRAHSDPTRMA